MGASESSEAVPAFMRCDGHYCRASREEAESVVERCGFLRLEGHGTCVLKKSEEHMSEVRGEWDVAGDEMIGITLRLPSGPLRLIMREGDDVGLITLAEEASDNGSGAACTFSFVPEEDEEGG